VLMAYVIDGRAGLLGVKEGDFMVGKLKLGPGILRLEAGRRRVAGSGKIRLRRGQARWRGRKRGPIGGARMVMT
jgi:hypothetical protein